MLQMLLLACCLFGGDPAAPNPWLRAQQLHKQSARPLLDPLLLSPVQEKQAAAIIDRFRKSLDRADDATTERINVERPGASEKAIAAFNRSIDDAIARRDRELKTILVGAQRDRFDGVKKSQQNGVFVCDQLYRSYELARVGDDRYEFTLTNRGKNTYHGVVCFVKIFDAAGNPILVGSGLAAADILRPGETFKQSFPVSGLPAKYTLEGGVKQVEEPTATMKRKSD